MTIRNKQGEIAFFRSKCKEHGMRVTHQKTMIYMAMLDSLDHPSPEQVFEKLKTVVHGLSLDTVYRTLSVFNEIGLIDLVEGYGTARRFDPMLEKHHHFRCRKCGTIIDFTSDYYDKIDIPEKISKECEVLNLRVTIEGICKKCQRKLR
jgi:Fur family transcriptional regulator, peroxide stress response regulator